VGKGACSRRVGGALASIAVISDDGGFDITARFHVLVGRVENLNGCLSSAARRVERRDALRGIVIAVVPCQVDTR
jgi:hypothetical protein